VSKSSFSPIFDTRNSIWLRVQLVGSVCSGFSVTSLAVRLNSSKFSVNSAFL
jgi:hypothetical protein